MYTKEERERYNEDRNRACKRLGITKNQYNWLRRKGEELRKVYENQCNGLYVTELESTQAEMSVGVSIGRYVHSLDLFIYYQTDPRGATIYLDLEPIPENNYTQAVCIY
jgi:cell wall assembly regulator SMI1